jgi:hypothetical protein
VPQFSILPDLNWSAQFLNKTHQGHINKQCKVVGWVQLPNADSSGNTFPYSNKYVPSIWKGIIFSLSSGLVFLFNK